MEKLYRLLKENLLYFRDEPQKSIAIIKTVAKHIPLEYRCEILYELAMMMADTSLYDLAIVIFEYVLDNSVNDKNKMLETLCYEALGHIHNICGDWSMALENHQKALRIYEENSDTYGAGYSHVKLAVIYCTIKKFSAAHSSYKKALPISIDTNDFELESDITLGLTVTYIHLYDFSSALFYGKQSLELKIRIGDRDGQISCYINLGIIYRHLGEVNKAIDCYTKVLQLAKKMTSKVREKECYINYGLLHLDLGNYEIALDFFKKALKIIKNNGYKKSTAMCYLNIGLALSHQGRINMAITNYIKALVIYNNQGDRLGESLCYENIGMAYGLIKQHKKVIEYNTIALKIQREIGAKSEEATCSMNIGTAYTCLKKIRPALHYFNNSLKLSKEINDVTKQRICINNIGWLYVDIQEYDKAITYFKNGIELYTSYRNHVLQLSLEEKKNILKENISLYKGAVLSFMKQGEVKKALQYTEMAKGRTILEFMTNRTIKRKSDIPEIETNEIMQLAKDIKRTLVYFKVLDDYTIIFFIHSNGYFNARTINLGYEKIKDLLVVYDNDNLVDGWIYWYGKFKEALSIAQRSLSVDRKLGDRTRSNLEFCKSRWFRSIDLTLEILSREIMCEIKRNIPNHEKITFIPDGPLNIIPLHACYVIDDNKKRYLIEDYEVAYAPSIKLLKLNYQHRNDNNQKNSLYALSNSVYPYDLRFSDHEVREISKYFDAKYILNKMSCNKQTFFDEARNYSVIHLATHGLYKYRDLYGSGIYLGENIFLTMKDILTELILGNVSLVCLSACESGLTDFRDDANEFFGLHSGFLYAGAQTVIASIWIVSDLATYLLMNMLYKNIYVEKMSKAKALQLAQTWMIHFSGDDADLVETIGGLDRKFRYEIQHVTGSVKRAASIVLPPPTRSELLDANCNKIHTKSQIMDYNHPYYWAGFQCLGVA